MPTRRIRFAIAPAITSDQRRSVYSAHPPPISLRQTPSDSVALNGIQGLFPTAILGWRVRPRLSDMPTNQPSGFCPSG
jgi:hypothetical protein